MQHDFGYFGRFAEADGKTSPESRAIADVELHIADSVKSGYVTVVGHLCNPVNAEDLSAMSMAGKLKIDAGFGIGDRTFGLMGQ